MFSKEREFIAIISFNEEVASRSDEVNGREQLAPVDYIEREFGWLQSSGLSLDKCALVDDDVQWECYLRYIVQWAIDQSSDEHIGNSPLSYESWKNGYSEKRTD